MNISNHSEEKYKKLAGSKYSGKDGKTEFFKNQSATFVLCTHAAVTTPQRPERPVSFFIYDLKEEKMIYESSVYNGSVEWHNDTQVMITTIPGMVRQEQEPGDNSVLYDVKTGQTSPLNPKKKPSDQ